MTPDKIVVGLFGIALIGFIWWFFFGKREKTVVSEGFVDILVDGGYQPSIIEIKRNTITTLRIRRKDRNSCLEEFVFPDVKLRRYLPLNEEISVRINIPKKGIYPFACGMNMFHGKIIVD